MQVTNQTSMIPTSPVVANNVQPDINHQHAFKKALTSATSEKTINIQWGDTLSQLAQTHHTTVASLAQLNHISNPDLIYAGNQLKLSSTNSSVSSSTPLKVTTTNTQLTNLNIAEQNARTYIVQHESGGSYTARNGKYIGKYQLDQSYLNGDFSPANQEKVAQKYVNQRYGSWVNAMAHWKTHSWY